MKRDAYERTLRARAFDISRYLLPLATNTSLGQIVNARTLETQVSRLLSHTHQEVRTLGDLLKRAATSPAFDMNQAAMLALVGEIRNLSPELGARAEQELLREVCAAPTLVKYADPNSYEIETRRELRQAAAELMRGSSIEPAGLVDLLDDESLELELATTLLYEHCHYPYRQIRQTVGAASQKLRQEIIDSGLRHRGKHDEMLRAFCAGQQFRFDILMDIGGFRDMHRHRRCIQIGQGFTTRQGFDTPEELVFAGEGARYEAAMKRASDTAANLSKLLLERNSNLLEKDERDWLSRAEKASGALASPAQYVIPLAFRKRTLFKMDFAEVVYISELRTTPAGHISYRKVAYAMYEAVIRRHPALPKYFRV